MTLRPFAAVAASLLMASAAHGGAAETLIAAINNCAAMTDDGQRHSCYDQLPALAKSLMPAAASESRAAAAPRPADGNGSGSSSWTLFGETAIPADHITATVESFTYDYGIFVVTLDNGQVWRQVAASSDLLPLSRSRKVQVIIWRDDFGRFVLKFEGYHTKYTVKRIK